MTDKDDADARGCAGCLGLVMVMFGLAGCGFIFGWQWGLAACGFVAAVMGGLLFGAAISKRKKQ